MHLTEKSSGTRWEAKKREGFNQTIENESSIRIGINNQKNWGCSIPQKLHLNGDNENGREMQAEFQ